MGGFSSVNNNLNIIIGGASILAAVAEAYTVNTSSTRGGDRCNAMIVTSYSSFKYTSVDWTQSGNYEMVLRTSRADIDYINFIGQISKDNTTYTQFNFNVDCNVGVYSRDYYNTANRAKSLYNTYESQSFNLKIGSHTWSF